MEQNIDQRMIDYQNGFKEGSSHALPSPATEKSINDIKRDLKSHETKEEQNGKYIRNLIIGSMGTILLAALSTGGFIATTKIKNEECVTKLEKQEAEMDELSDRIKTNEIGYEGIRSDITNMKDYLERIATALDVK